MWSLVANATPNRIPPGWRPVTDRLTSHRRTSRWSGLVDPWQQHSAGRRCSTRRASHLGSATLLVNRERPTLVSGAACHRYIRFVRRRGGHAIQGNRERRDGSRCPRSEDQWTPINRRSAPPENQGLPSRQPTVVVPRARRRGRRPSGATKRGRCTQRKGHSTTWAGYPMLPERCSWRIGEAQLQGVTPLENPYPSRCGLDSVRADALMGFRLLRDFSPGPARDAFAPSTSTSFTALLTRRS
jgi:hypothetical protein